MTYYAENFSLEYESSMGFLLPKTKRLLEWISRYGARRALSRSIDPSVRVYSPRLDGEFLVGRDRDTVATVREGRPDVLSVQQDF